MNNPTIFAIVNICIQLSAIFANQMLGLMWPIYIIIGMLSLVVVIQTLAAAVFLAGHPTPEKKYERADRGISALVGVTYGASCYQLYMIDFTFLAAMASTHVAIMIFANLLRKE